MACSIIGDCFTKEKRLRKTAGWNQTAGWNHIRRVWNARLRNLDFFCRKLGAIKIWCGVTCAELMEDRPETGKDAGRDTC